MLNICTQSIRFGPVAAPGVATIYNLTDPGMKNKETQKKKANRLTHVHTYAKNALTGTQARSNHYCWLFLPPLARALAGGMAPLPADPTKFPWQGPLHAQVGPVQSTAYEAPGLSFSIIEFD